MVDIEQGTATQSYLRTAGRSGDQVTLDTADQSGDEQPHPINQLSLSAANRKLKPLVERRYFEDASLRISPASSMVTRTSRFIFLPPGSGTSL